jgi:hypothetical protein
MRQKKRKSDMSKQAMRTETERLVKEALERKTITVRDQMRKVRRTKSHLSRSRRGSGPVHV